MSDNYYNEFLGDESPLNQDTEKPKNDISWTKLHPTAEKAYQAINDIKEAKLRYIKGHTDSKQFKKKSLWNISKSEVARNVGGTSQSLFNCCSYSSKLAKYLKDIQESLETAVDIQLKRVKKGLHHESKEDVVHKSQKLIKEVKKIRQENCEVLFQKLLDEIPLDVKRKLRLI